MTVLAKLCVTGLLLGGMLMLVASVLGLTIGSIAVIEGIATVGGVTMLLGLSTGVIGLIVDVWKR